jgi:hypothetical protein
VHLVECFGVGDEATCAGAIPTSEAVGGDRDDGGDVEESCFGGG